MSKNIMEISTALRRFRADAARTHMTEVKKHMANIEPDAGKANKQFLASYEHGGHDWSLTFYALDMADAQKKVISIRRTLRFDGETVAAIKLPWFRWGVLRQWWRR